MSCKTCRYFPDCSAPICPEDPESLAYCAWFPDEEICKRADYAGTSWIRRQKRIARATVKDYWRGCFTMAMLDHPCQIGAGIKGLDPDKGEITEARVKEWMGKHPPVSAKRRAASRAQAAKARTFLERPAGEMGASTASKLPQDPPAPLGTGKAPEAHRSRPGQPSTDPVDILEKSL